MRGLLSAHKELQFLRGWQGKELTIIKWCDAFLDGRGCRSYGKPEDRHQPTKAGWRVATDGLLEGSNC
jgi:hypothetical protein